MALHYTGDSLNNIRQFTNTGWLNNNAVRMIFLKYLFQCSTKITNQ